MELILIGTLTIFKTMGIINLVFILLEYVFAAIFVNMQLKNEVILNWKVYWFKLQKFLFKNVKKIYMLLITFKPVEQTANVISYLLVWSILVI